MTERKVRAFIAIQLPRELRSALHTMAAPLRSLPLGVRWVPESNYHLTLKFLGGIAADDIKSLGAQLQICAERDSFSLSLGGWGMFPGPKRPSVFWVGLGGELEALQSLWINMEDRLSALGYSREPRFHPHITLGRFRSQDNVDSMVALLQQGPFFDKAGSFRAMSLCLMESRPGSTGPSYHPLASYEFKPARY
jgi:2'-5' RNA ligase